MTITLRVLLMIAAVFSAMWILHKIRKHKMQMEHAIYWMIFALILLILGLFPEIAYHCANLLGIQSPANLIFLVIIFLLLMKVSTLSVVVSQMEEKIAVLSAEVAIRTHAAEEQKEESHKEEKEIEK